jgi:chemotaxis protein CheX
MRREEFENNYIKPIMARAVDFITHEAGIHIAEEKCEFDTPSVIELESKTVLIGTNGGELNALFAVSYAPDLLDKLMRTLNYGDILPEEEQELLEATACEIVNTIIGNAIAHFPNKGEGITLTPPIILNNLTSISKRDDAEIIVTDMNTEYGKFILNLIWPQFMYENSLGKIKY